jgi:hypothetical protein
VLLAGIAYSLGRALTYVTVAAVAVASLLSIPSVSFFLQQQMNRVLGPLLMATGLVMVGWLRLPWLGNRGVGALEQRLAGAGILGAGGLGILFALSFCPVSAGLFFGGLLPLATGTGVTVRPAGDLRDRDRASGRGGGRVAGLGRWWHRPGFRRAHPIRAEWRRASRAA